MILESWNTAQSCSVVTAIFSYVGSMRHFFLIFDTHRETLLYQLLFDREP